MQAIGHEVAEREGLRFFASLPEPDTALMLYALPTSGRDGLHLRLLGWVARGGHLIVPAPDEPLSPQQKNFLRRVGAVRFSGDKAPGRGDLLLRGTVLGQPVLGQLALGGTAVGTGLNAPAGFDSLAAKRLSALTSYCFRTAPNKFHALTSKDAVVFGLGRLLVPP